jgi:hypothetical protein
VIAEIRWPASETTSSPIEWKWPTLGSHTYRAKAGFPSSKTHPPSPLPAPTSRRGAGYKIHRHRRLLEGLIAFGEAVVPGSARVIASVGDETNALLMVSVKAAFAPGAPQLTLPAARL